MKKRVLCLNLMTKLIFLKHFTCVHHRVIILKLLREAIDSSTIDTKEQELYDHSIMVFKIAESKVTNKKERITYDFRFYY